MKEGLHNGWDVTDLENLCTIATGKRDVNEGNPNGVYPFFTCAQGIYKIDEYEFDGKAILVAGNGFFNVKYFEGKFNAYQRTYVLQNFPINEKYLYWYINHSLDVITKDKRGSTVKYIRLGDLTGHPVNIPPLNEQKRIAAKLDQIMPKIDELKERLLLIEKIERRTQLCFYYSNGQQYLLEGLGKYCVEREERYGRKYPNLWKIGVNKDTGIIDLRSKAKDYSKYKIVKNGDFIYNPMRINIGSIARYGGKDDCLTSPDYVVFYAKEELSASLLLLYLKSPQGLLEINHNSQGSVRSRLYYENLCNIQMPIAPAKKQQEAEFILNKFKTIKKQIGEIIERMDFLKRSILAKAFRGELVPQDPNDEPAEKLLERIKEEKAKMEAELKKTKKNVGGRKKAK